ncbi:MAG: hypothetical protein ACK4F5_01780 [Aliihoeflea sp.]
MLDFAQFARGDWFGLAGIVISLLGFGLALHQINKTHTAAESARDSAKSATDGIRRLDSLIGFTSVLKSVDEIKAAYRLDEYEKLPNLFDQARRSLISARENHPNLSTQETSRIQKSLTFLKQMEIEITHSDANSRSSQKQKYTKSLIELSDDLASITSKTRTMGN